VRKQFDPSPTLARNRLGSNGSFPLRFIAGPPYLRAPRSYEASREGNVRQIAGSLVAALPLDLSAELLGEVFDQPGADPGIRASRIDPEGSTARTATAHAHLLMTGLILDSKNMILPEDPAISPCWFAKAPAGLPIMPQLGFAVGNVHYRFDGDYSFMCMSWEGEKRGAF
jgi:hypothetical protein